jgi:hypothetical protein
MSVGARAVAVIAVVAEEPGALIAVTLVAVIVAHEPATLVAVAIILAHAVTLVAIVVAAPEVPALVTLAAVTVVIVAREPTGLVTIPIVRAHRMAHVVAMVIAGEAVPLVTVLFPGPRGVGPSAPIVIAHEAAALIAVVMEVAPAPRAPAVVAVPSLLSLHGRSPARKPMTLNRLRALAHRPEPPMAVGMEPARQSSCGVAVPRPHTVVCRRRTRRASSAAPRS